MHPRRENLEHSSGGRGKMAKGYLMTLVDRYVAMRGTAVPILAVVTTVVGAKTVFDSMGWLGYGGPRADWYSSSVKMQFLLSLTLTIRACTAFRATRIWVLTSELALFTASGLLLYWILWGSNIAHEYLAPMGMDQGPLIPPIRSGYVLIAVVLVQVTADCITWAVAAVQAAKSKSAGEPVV